MGCGPSGEQTLHQEQTPRPSKLRLSTSSIHQRCGQSTLKRAGRLRGGEGGGRRRPGQGRGGKGGCGSLSTAVLTRTTGAGVPETDPEDTSWSLLKRELYGGEKSELRRTALLFKGSSGHVSPALLQGQAVLRGRAALSLAASPSALSS